MKPTLSLRRVTVVVALCAGLGACGDEGQMALDVPSDKDGDGVVDTEDVCPGVADPAQADFDGDGLGDACDADADGDLVASPADCDDLDPDQDVARTLFADADGDGLGDPATPIETCDQPEGYVENAEDAEPACATNDTDDCGVCGGPGRSGGGQTVMETDSVTHGRRSTRVTRRRGSSTTAMIPIRSVPTTTSTRAGFAVGRMPRWTASVCALGMRVSTTAVSAMDRA